VSSHLFEALAIYFSYGYLHEQGNQRVNFVNARHLFKAKVIGFFQSLTFQKFDFFFLDRNGG
jgi:hypothetical protein